MGPTAKPTSRERMIRSAAALIRRHGLTGTSFSDVLNHSGAPRGSIYHHFPDGKTQLAHAAVDLTAAQVNTVLATLPAESARDLVAGFISIWLQAVDDDPGQGCPVAGTVLDTADTALLDTARTAFSLWRDTLATRLHDLGVAADRAPAVATTVIAAVEGALVLCRAERSAAPLRTVAGELARLH